MITTAVAKSFRKAERNWRATRAPLRVAIKRPNPPFPAGLPAYNYVQAHLYGQYTAMYSKTARARELGTTHDWVVIYREGAGDHGQWTVITSHSGPLKGRRVVRGREAECEAYYAS